MLTQLGIDSVIYLGMRVSHCRLNCTSGALITLRYLIVTMPCKFKRIKAVLGLCGAIVMDVIHPGNASKYSVNIKDIGRVVSVVMIDHLIIGNSLMV